MIKIVNMIVFSLLVVGCSLLVRTKYVEYAVKNESGGRLDDVRVCINSTHCFAHGVLIPDADKGFAGPIKLEKENQVEISWRNSAHETNRCMRIVGKKTLLDKRTCLFVIDTNMQVDLKWRF